MAGWSSFTGPKISFLSKICTISKLDRLSILSAISVPVDLQANLQGNALFSWQFHQHIRLSDVLLRTYSSWTENVSSIHETSGNCVQEDRHNPVLVAVTCLHQ